MLITKKVNNMNMESEASLEYELFKNFTAIYFGRCSIGIKLNKIILFQNHEIN